MKKVVFIMALVALIGTTACGQKKGNRITPLKNEKDTQTALEEQVMKMDEGLRADIAEMLLVGFRGTEVNEKSTIVRDIEQYHIGGVILYEYDGISGTHGRNITSAKQLQMLCSTLQKAAKGSLFIGVDQEGGKVCRLGKKQGFPSIPSAQTMAKGGIDSVLHYSLLTAKTLKGVGINLNFAPCVDVDNPKCPVIGGLGRSFGKDPLHIAKLAEAWIEGHRKGGVMCCLKHFPGHGNSTGDTHEGLVDVTGAWSPEEMEPYHLLIEKKQADMVMMAHVMNKDWESEIPASLNKRCYEMLRQEMQFDGLVITDDLCMGAITKMFPYEKVLMMSIQAGADILCLSNNAGSYNEDLVPMTIELIGAMVEDGTIDAERIHQSAEKIRKYKKQLQER